jgi:hypothetical protein
MPAARPMTRGRWESIQEVISLPTEPPSHTPYRQISTCYPRTYFRTYTYVTTLSSTGTTRPIQEILLQSVTAVCAELRARTAQHAVGVIARICIVGLCITAHDGLALQIPRRTLSRRTGESIATARAIILGLVFRAVRIRSCAELLWVAGASGIAADGRV